MKRNLFALALAFAAAAAAADGPVGIRAKWANGAELAITNLAVGELVLNTDVPGDLRVGDGETPGGVSHVGRRDNPHGVTLQQLVDNPARDYMADELGLSVYPGEGISSIGGFGRVISLEGGYIDGDFSFSSRPSLLSDGLATTNEVAAVADSVSAVSNRVSSIEADYATSGDVAAAVEPLATTASVASVERRVGGVEERLEEYWCQWNTDALVPLPATNYIPTNWPARKVLCFLPNSTTTGYRIALPNWEPDEDCELRLGLWKAATNNFQSIVVDAGGGQVSVVSGNGAQGRECIFRYKFGIGWVFTSHSYTGVPYHIRNGIRRNIPNASLPEGGDFAPVVDGASE